MTDDAAAAPASAESDDRPARSSGRVREALRRADRGREVEPMVHPLDLPALRRREGRARSARLRARELGPGARIGASLGWAQARLDVTRGMRVVNLFLFHYGTVMAAGAAYMMFFSVAAALVAGFAVAGLFVGGDAELQELITRSVNTVLPGVIDDGSGGLATPEQLFDTRGLSLTLIVSLAALVVTSLSWLHGLRSGIRSIFDRPLMGENVLVVKARDLVMMLLVGTMFIIAGAMGALSSELLGRVMVWLGSEDAVAHEALTRAATLSAAFILDVLIAVLLMRVASRIVIPVWALWQAALIAGVGVSLLRVLSAELLASTTANPILVPFTTVLGLFFYFFLFSLIYLLAASWAAVAASERERRRAGRGRRRARPRMQG
ncbi:YihY/virulence factor BrkB family protein [Nesterenkonia sp. F]|uniref:YihY/virulence factor BrkB family protein n=1 Tax=Nesterenkonia sp. F TaxID=795955 RepID=UPI0002E0D335|nr:YihY/virulence factor BrkB family protein [Nesterenkonia sp. F]